LDGKTCELTGAGVSAPLEGGEKEAAALEDAEDWPAVAADDIPGEPPEEPEGKFAGILGKTNG
jgi:hypothetical protein